MVTSLRMLSVVLLGLAVAPQPAVGQGPLEALGELMVGTWESADSRHEHEWGVGRQLIRSRSYFLVDGTWVLVAEGIWFWDDEEQTLRGTHLAIEMPMNRLEYRTTVRGDAVRHDLRTYGEAAERLVETWNFEDGAYTWEVERRTDDGLERMMGGRYRRVG